jgi:dTMP kinase
MSRLWVTLEGVEGVGKTYLAQRLARRLGPRCTLLTELTDQDAEGLPGQVVTALSQAGDLFLRTGHPLTETFALLALKVREYERLQSAGSSVDIVLEDRGVDSVAVYQAAILASEGPLQRMRTLAERIHAAAARWRPLPDLTVLLIDDLDVCERRFAERIGRPLREDERALMRHADQLYAWQAEAAPARVAVMDRAGATEEEILDRLQRTCLTRARLGRQRCAT